MTKSQVNKLGKEIRGKLRDNIPLSEIDLLSLQTYRTSFKDDLAGVFHNISTLSRNERKDSIVSFRIKRIESILSKIKREPTMSLGNMGDIAGCRVILYSESALENLVFAIKKKYVVKNFNDYTVTPKEDGYSGYHLYIESPMNPNKLLEIQLRTMVTHKWASLVEIIDVILNLKLKEGQKNEQLKKFLKLLSIKKELLSLDQKKEIIDIDSKFKIYKLLNEVFLRNYISIRKSWLTLSNNLNNFYFIIEVDVNKKSNIFSISDYKEAEDKYFNMFLENKNSNFVLAYIENPNYKKICIAYSSYILIKHDYLEDWNLFAKEILKDGYDENGKSRRIYADLIARNLKDQRDILSNEIAELNAYLDNNELKGLYAINEWIQELKERSIAIESFHQEALKMIIPQKSNIWRQIYGQLKA